MNIPQQVEFFKKLPYETKKQKVLEMLRQLQGIDEIFLMLYKTLTFLDKVSDVVLLYIYQAILEIAHEIEMGNKQKAYDKMKKISEVLTVIKEQEAMEIEHEISPEEILKHL